MTNNKQTESAMTKATGPAVDAAPIGMNEFDTIQYGSSLVTSNDKEHLLDFRNYEIATITDDGELTINKNIKISDMMQMEPIYLRLVAVLATHAADLLEAKNSV